MILPAITALAEGGHDIPVVDPSPAGSLALPLVLVVALPAFGAAFLLLGGRRTDACGHLVGCATVVGSFICSTVAVRRDPRPRRRRPADQPDAVDVVQRRGLDGRARAALRPAVGAVPAADHRRRRTDPHLLDRLHGARRAPPAVLRLPQPVRRVDARAGPRVRLRRCLPGLGGRRPHVVPADRVLAVQALGGGRRQEGVRDQPRRRHRALPRHRPDLRHLRHHVVREGLRADRRRLARS